MAPDLATQLARAGRKWKLEHDVGQPWRGGSGQDESDGLCCDGSDEEIGLSIEQAFDNGSHRIWQRSTSGAKKARSHKPSGTRSGTERSPNTASCRGASSTHARAGGVHRKFSCRHRGPRSAAEAEKAEERRNERRRLRQIELDHESAARAARQASINWATEWHARSQYAPRYEQVGSAKMKEACDRLERLPVLKFGVVGAGPRSIRTDLFEEATHGVKCWTTRLLRNAANRWRTLAQRRWNQVQDHDEQTDGALPFNCLRPGLDEPVYFRASSS